MSVFFGAAEGTAYRFDLRHYGSPPAEGDKVKVDVEFVADGHSHLLVADALLCQHLVTPRKILDRVHALQLVTDREILLVPMDLKGELEVKEAVVTAHRWPKPSTAAIALAADPPSPATSDSQAQSSHSERREFKPRWKKDWGSRFPFDFVSRIPPVQGFGPLSSRLSNDGALVALFPVYRDRKEEKVEDYDNPAIENELPANVVCDRPIRFIRYIDVVPSGDLLPAHARIYDKRFAANDVWSVSSRLQTYFKATKTDPELRMQDWHLLTTPELGLPGRMEVFGFDWTMAGVKHHRELYTHPFKTVGPAVLKLVPVDRNYECQPKSASSAASYILKHWRVIVEREGVQLNIFDYAHGRTVDWLHNMVLEHLAEMASAERAPGQILYSMVPYWYCARVFGVGVRLRDGGSRLPLKTDKKGQSCFEVPGDPHLHSKWGRFDGKDRSKYKPDRFFKPAIKAELRVKVPKGAQDVVIKVNDSISGDYNQLEYAIRPNGSYKPIKAHEWRHLGAEQLDEWIVCFFINLAKVTYGCLNRDLVRPSPSQCWPSPSRAPPSDSSDENSSDEASSPPKAANKEVKKEKKKPRLS